jgi:hypothetical protein
VITTEFLPFLREQAAQVKAISLPKARAAKAEKTDGSVNQNSDSQKGRNVQQMNANSTVGQPPGQPGYSIETARNAIREQPIQSTGRTVGEGVGAPLGRAWSR